MSDSEWIPASKPEAEPYLSDELILETKLWTISQIAKFINDGGGTFRKFIYEYLDLEYAEAYDAGAMIITNALYNRDEKCERYI